MKQVAIARLFRLLDNKVNSVIIDENGPKRIGTNGGLTKFGEITLNQICSYPEPLLILLR